MSQRVIIREQLDIQIPEAYCVFYVFHKGSQRTDE